MEFDPEDLSGRLWSVDSGNKESEPSPAKPLTSKEAPHHPWAMIQHADRVEWFLQHKPDLFQNEW